MPPRSSNFASSIQYSSFRFVADLSLGFYSFVSEMSPLQALVVSVANLPLSRRQVPYRRHVKGIEEDVLPPIPEVVLTCR